MPTTRQPLDTLVLSIYRELTEEFQAAAAAAQQTNPVLGQADLRFDLVAGEPGHDPAFEECLGRAQVAAIVVRFLDVLSLEKIKNLYRSLQAKPALPVGFFLLREPGEVDFKISCPSCGQKLWLRDTDVGKRGRCPNCTKPFLIFSQAEYLKSQLTLPDKVGIHTLTRQRPDTFAAAFLQLARAVPEGLAPADQDVNLEALKNATVRIQIQDA